MTKTPNRTALLEEAAKTLNRRGLSHTSLSEIAETVGISRSALYYYVEDIHDLVYRCYRQTCEQLSGMLQEASEQFDDELDVLCCFVELALREDRAELASISEIAFLKIDQRHGIMGLYRGVRLTLAEVVSNGIEKGVIRPVNPQVTASILLSLIFWVPVVMRWPAARELSKSEISSTMMQLIRVGVAKKREGALHYERFDFSPFISITGNAFNSELRAAARKETLLASASWLFNQKGVDATSLDEVAQRVGVSKKVIYHNVGNKERLVAECYLRSFRMFEFVSSHLESYPGTRIDALCTALASLAEANSRSDLTPLIPMTGHDSWPDEVRGDLNESAVRLQKLNLSVYEAGFAERSFRRVNPNCVIMLTPGIYEWMSQWLETLPDTERVGAPNEVANFLRLGLSSL